MIIQIYLTIYPLKQQEIDTSLQIAERLFHLSLPFLRRVFEIEWTEPNDQEQRNDNFEVSNLTFIFKTIVRVLQLRALFW